MENKIKFTLMGAETIYKGKQLLRDMLKLGPIKVYLEISGDKIIATLDSALCGYIDKTSAEKMKPLLKENDYAVITIISGTNFIGHYEIGQEAIEKELTIKSLKEMTAYILNKNLDNKDNLEAKLEYLEKCKVPEKAQLNMFKSYVLYPNEVANKIPKKPKTLYQDNSGIVKKSISYMNISRNLMFEGDRGVGKNVLTETLCWLFNRPLFEFSMNSQHDNNSLLGGKVFEDNHSVEELNTIQQFFAKFINIFNPISNLFKNSKKEEAETTISAVSKALTSLVNKQEMSFEASVIVLAAKYGGVIVFDEFNTSLAHVMSLFNSLLDDRRRITVPGYEVIDAHPNFLAIATQNKDYVGTFESNEATVDRFVPIIFPTLTSIENILMAKIPSISYETVKTCQLIFNGLKKSVQDGNVSEKALTIRGFIDACLVIEQGVSLKEALIDNIANRANDIDDRNSILNMIDAQVI